MKKTIMIILLAISFIGCKSLKKRTEELDAIARANSSGVSSSQEFHREEDELRMERKTYFDVKDYTVNDLSIKVLSRPKIDATLYNKEFKAHPRYLSSMEYKYNNIDFVEYDFLDITYGDSMKEEKSKIIMAFVNRELQTFVLYSAVRTENQVKEFRDWVAKIDSQLK